MDKWSDHVETRNSFSIVGASTLNWLSIFISKSCKVLPKKNKKLTVLFYFKMVSWKLDVFHKVFKGMKFYNRNPKMWYLIEISQFDYTFSSLWLSFCFISLKFSKSFKIAATDTRYLARNKLSRSLVHQENLGLTWHIVQAYTNFQIQNISPLKKNNIPVDTGRKLNVQFMSYIYGSSFDVGIRILSRSVGYLFWVRRSLSKNRKQLVIS